jgi:hypothetical protein
MGDRHADLLRRSDLQQSKGGVALASGATGAFASGVCTENLNSGVVVIESAKDGA